MHVVVDLEVSADGRVLPVGDGEGHDGRVGGPDYADRLDRRRAAADAVVVDVHAVRTADPTATVSVEARRVERLRAGRPATPERVVVDPTADTPPDAAVFDGEERIRVLVTGAASADATEALESAGATVTTVGAVDGEVDPDAALAALDGAERVAVEAGGAFVRSLFAAALVDELSTYVAPTLVAGESPRTLTAGPTFPEPIGLDLDAVDRLEGGVLLSYTA